MHLSVKIIAMAALVSAIPSSAGEINGNGDSTPVDSFRAASICSFSGLNDDSAPTPDIVQTYGMIMRAVGGHSNGAPGVDCRGN